MANIEKKRVQFASATKIAVFFWILTASQVSQALTITCEEQALVDTYFTISISHAGADAVGLISGNTRHVFEGSEHEWQWSEASVGTHFYHADAYVGGQWISLGEVFCNVNVIKATDYPGNVTITDLPKEIALGNTVEIEVVFQDSSWTRNIVLEHNDVAIAEAIWCSGGTCTLQESVLPDIGMHHFKAVGIDQDNNIYFSQIESVNVTTTDPSITAPPNVPIPVLNEYPVIVNQTVRIMVTGTDDGDLESVSLQIDGSNVYTQSCFGAAQFNCTLEYDHIFTRVGAHEIKAIAEDVSGNFSESVGTWIGVIY